MGVGRKGVAEREVEEITQQRVEQASLCSILDMKKFSQGIFSCFRVNRAKASFT